MKSLNCVIYCQQIQNTIFLQRYFTTEYSICSGLPADPKYYFSSKIFQIKGLNIQIAVGCQRIHRGKRCWFRGVVVIIIIIKSLQNILLSFLQESENIEFTITTGDWKYRMSDSGESSPPSAAPTPENPAPRSNSNKRYLSLFLSRINQHQFPPVRPRAKWVWRRSPRLPCPRHLQRSECNLQDPPRFTTPKTQELELNCC